MVRVTLFNNKEHASKGKVFESFLFDDTNCFVSFRRLIASLVPSYIVVIEPYKD